MINKRAITGEALKDQAITNLELLYDELIGGEEYLLKDVSNIKDKKTIIEDGCVGCKNYKDKKCIHGIRHGIECIDGDYKFKEV